MTPEEEAAKKEEARERKAAAHLARYSEHNSRLQTWIGSYGAGFASLLVYQFRTSVSDTRQLFDLQSVKDAPKFEVIFAKMLFDLRVSLALVALALALQVALLFKNKVTQWALAHPQKKGDVARWWYRQSSALSKRPSIDIVFDVGSILLLVCATIKGLDALRIL